MSQYYRNHPDEPISHDWVSSSNFSARRVVKQRVAPATDGTADSVPKGNGEEPDNKSNPQTKLV